MSAILLDLVSYSVCPGPSVNWVAGFFIPSYYLAILVICSMMTTELSFNSRSATSWMIFGGPHLLSSFIPSSWMYSASILSLMTCAGHTHRPRPTVGAFSVVILVHIRSWSVSIPIRSMRERDPPRAIGCRNVYCLDSGALTALLLSVCAGRRSIAPSTMFMSPIMNFRFAVGSLGAYTPSMDRGLPSACFVSSNNALPWITSLAWASSVAIRFLFITMASP
ncbi:unnamed protein product, partial [Mycena citricolor]